MSADFETMNHADLKARWVQAIGSQPPVSASSKFLRRALAYERQCKTSAGLTRSVLKQLADGLGDNTSKRNATRTPRPKVKIVQGSRLIREWNGKSYTVSVTEEGLIYRDQVWPSLSAIARDITGAHWSGPRFFGVNGARQCR